ncbi:MAG: hypothetical protein WA110_07500 [Anaerolineaceae bacterium]
MKNKKFLNIIKWVWLAVVLAAAGYYFFKHKEEVSNLISQISFFRILLSLVLLLLGKSLIVLLTKFSVNAEGWYPSYWKTLGLYGITSLGKYIPGGIWHFVGRIGAYHANGLSGKKATRALILENVWLISSAVAVGLSLLCLFRFDLISGYIKLPNEPWIAGVLTVGILGLWILGLWLVNHFMNKHTENKIQKVWVIVPVSILLWLLIGSSFFTMFTDFPLSQAGVFIGGYALSWAVGYVAVFAPGGIGVREAVLAFVFSNITSVEMIAVYAAMNRIIWVVAEVLFGLVGFIQKQEMLPQNTNGGEEETSGQELIE